MQSVLYPKFSFCFNIPTSGCRNMFFIQLTVIFSAGVRYIINI